MKIIHWIVRIIVALLIVVLALNNMQRVEFNFYGIYTWNFPLILLVFIMLALGILIGLIFGLVRHISLKSQIHTLKKELNNKNTATIQ